jgi:nitrate reductase delta subunit
MERLHEFDRLAALLRYPGEGYQRAAERCVEALSESDSEAASLLGKFLERTQDCPVEELQALYTATFDLDPACSLEVGWHLFGENYERGEFLVKMRGELRRLGLSESTELPDHLTHVLEALARMEPEEAEEFVTACLFPALDKMCVALQGRSNLLENIVLAVVRTLESRYPRPAPEAVPAGAAFRILDSGGW